MQSDSGHGAQPLDIVFISYDESNSDRNWIDLKTRFPRARRVHGVKGIREAHQQAALKSKTPFFFSVDGDNRVCPEFSFAAPNCELEQDSIYVYRCRNPLNDLVYGYGAVKIYNKSLLLHSTETPYVDLATSVTRNYKILNEVASETHFFSTPEEAWRGAFREAYKLASQLLDRPDLTESRERLQRWCEFESNLRNAEWAQLGARQGRDMAQSPQREGCNINDFSWLRKVFHEFAEK